MLKRYSREMPLLRWAWLLVLLVLLPLAGRAQTFYDLSTSNYSQDFADIANWTNNFAAGAGASNYRTATNVASSLVTQPTVFVTGVAGGVQKGTLNIVLLATGSGSPQNEAAFDLLLNFSNRTAGNLSFDYSKVVNTANASPRKLTLKAQYSLDNGLTFTDFSGYTQPVVNNNATVEAGPITIALPAALSNQAQVVVRFYAFPNGDNTGAGNRPKIAIDNVAVTSTAVATVTCVAPAAPTFSGTNSSSTSVAFVPSATNTSPYTVTATPTAGGTAITATGTSSPIGLAGLAASTGYSVTVTATCTAAAGGGTVTSAAATVTTSAASVTCVAPTGVSATPGSTSASIAFTGDATASGGYTVSATPTAGGTAITNTGASSPIALTGLAANTQYSVTVTSSCGSNGTATSSPAVTFTTLAPNPEINVQVAGVDYLTGSAYDFGTTNFGTPVGPVTFTVQNTSTTDVLTVSGAGITSSTGAGFTLSAPATPFTVAPSSTATFTVTFSPTTAGAKTGVVTITNNDQNEASYVINLTGQSNTPPPTATNYSATSILAGIQSTEVVTGTNLTGTTVTITGSTAGTIAVGTVTASSTQASFTLLAPQAGSFTLNITTPGGTLTQLVTVTTPPAGFFEPFEIATKGTYTASPGASVALTTGSWNFTEAVLGAQAPSSPTATGDKKNNGQAARLRGGGTVAMLFDKTGGAGTVTVQAAIYSTDAAAGLTLEYSTDGGANFLAAPGSPVALTTTLTPYNFTLNVAGAVRLRFGTTNTSIGNNPRTDIDDVQMTDFAAAVCNAPTGLTPGSITSTSATVSFTGSGTATGYTVTTVPVTTTQTLAGTATSVSFTGLTPGTAYTVSIVSNCAGGATSGAATVGFSTTAAAPALVVTQGGTPVTSNGSPSYSFGNQTTGTTQTATFTLTNSGPDPLTISGISATNSAVFNFQPFTTPATLAANGGNTTVTVTYTVGTGPQSGTIGITSNATNGNASFQLTLTGTGVPLVANPQIAVSQGGTGIANGGSFSGFAGTTVGSTSAPVTFSIANASTTDNLTLGTFVLTGPFALSAAQPTAVAANGTPATFSLTFTPTATGANIGTLTIPNNSQANNPYVITLGGLGTSATPTDLTVSTTQAIAGSYRNVTVTGTGRALVAGPLVISGALVIQAGGILSQNCQTISGPGSFEVMAGALLGICDVTGIATTGAVGAVQVTGLRTFSPAAGYSYTNPTTAQVTGPGLPAQIFGLGLDNPAGLTLSQGVAVAQQVTLQRGNLSTGGQPFTLLSSAAGTAVVDNTGGVVNGTTTVQRYIDSSNPVGYRHYSAPVSNTTLSDLATAGFSPIFNTNYNNSPTPGALRPFPTVFGYDQGRIATVTSTYGAFDKGWFSPAATDAMTVNRGYTANAPNTSLVDFVGTLNNGVQPSGALSRGPDADAGWQFLGNPYPAPLDWNTVTPAQRLGMDAAMYVFQSSGQYGGSYRTYANGVGASSLIDVASGYFTRVTTAGTAGAVNLTNANRVLTFGAQPTFGRGVADTRPQLQLQLRGTTGLDDAYVYFQTGATAGLDAEFDAVKLPNPTGLNLASVVGARPAAINGLPLLGTAAVVVPLSVGVPQAGSYSFRAADLANFTGTVTLLDALGNTRTVLTPGTTYAFTVAGTSITGRFALEFRPAGVLATTSAQTLAAQLQLFPNPASASFRVQLPVLGSKAVVAATLTNTLGQTVLSRSLSAPAGQAIDAEFDVRALAAGVYTLRLTVDGTLLVRKVVVE